MINGSYETLGELEDLDELFDEEEFVSFEDDDFLEYEDDEYEMDFDFADGFEAESDGADLLEAMAYYAELAAEAESEAETDEFIGAIASLAGPLIASLLREEAEYEEEDPFLGSVVKIARSIIPKAMPIIRRGAQVLGGVLRKRGRNLIRAMPGILAKTARGVISQASTGRPITPRGIGISLARNAARTLGNRRQLARILRSNRAAARRYRLQHKIPTYRGQRRRQVVRPRYCVL